MYEEKKTRKCFNKKRGNLGKKIEKEKKKGFIYKSELREYYIFIHKNMNLRTFTFIKSFKQKRVL